MPKERELIKRIRREAKLQGIQFKKLRSGSRHDIWLLGDCLFPIPRHSEIKQVTAERTYKQCEQQLGKDWWAK